MDLVRDFIQTVVRLEVSGEGQDIDLFLQGLDEIERQWSRTVTDEDRPRIHQFAASRRFFRACEASRSFHEKEAYYRALERYGFVANIERAKALWFRGCYLEETGRCRELPEFAEFIDEVLEQLSHVPSLDARYVASWFDQDALARWRTNGNT